MGIYEFERDFVPNFKGELVIALELTTKSKFLTTINTCTNKNGINNYLKKKSDLLLLWQNPLLL